MFTYEQGFEEGLEVGYELGLAEAARQFSAAASNQPKGKSMSTEVRDTGSRL